MRQRLGLRLDDLSAESGLSRNALSRLERGATKKVHPWILGRVLPFLAALFKETFPEAGGDPYDFLTPPTTFGTWLKNFRMRRGLKLKDLAARLKVRPFTIIRYEADESKPSPSVRQNLRTLYRLNGQLDGFL